MRRTLAAILVATLGTGTIAATAHYVRAEEPAATPATSRADVSIGAGRAERQRPQLSAAAYDAQDALRRDLFAAPLTADLSVRQFLDRTGGAEPLLVVIEDARQQGGTRWLDDETVEIRLEVPGAEAADVLAKLAAANPTRLNVDPDALRRGLDDLRRRTFSAVGRSSGAKNLANARPPDGAGAWQGVPERERAEAVLTARENAVARVVESLRPMPLGNGKTVDDALAVPEVAGELRQWIEGRPFTDLEFSDDRRVRLTLSAPPEEFFPVLRSALARHGQGPAADDAESWGRLQATVKEGLAPAEGRSAVTAPATNPDTRNAAPQIPDDPPKWASRQLDADGDSQGRGLKTARAAEAAALNRLREQVEALPLNDRMTLGDAAKLDPRFERAIADVVRRATTTKVDYQEQGFVKVRVSLDLTRLWRELNLLR